MTQHWSDSQSAAAEARGRDLLESEPHATAARYDARTARVVVELSNGATFAFPPRLAQDLDGASDVALAGVTVSGAGFGLYWPELDADLSLSAMLAGRFGSKAWMSELARRAGSVTSPAKAAAARANGAKGGRPRKVG
jgi:hypothetical protein